MNIEKLTSEINQATEKKAADELDRMIKLHEDEVNKRKESIKRYLLSLATTNATPGYTIADENSALLARHIVILEELEGIKKELQ